jgi:hypothetical protein
MDPEEERMRALKWKVTIATVALASALAAPEATSAAPPARNCPPPFTASPLSEFPPEIVAAVNKNGDNILCGMLFRNRPGGNVVDNTAAVGVSP